FFFAGPATTRTYTLSLHDALPICDERAEIECVDLLAVQRLGHVVGHDLLGQTLDDGGLAHAGLADEDRVVLGAAGEDLHQEQPRSEEHTSELQSLAYLVCRLLLEK